MEVLLAWEGNEGNCEEYRAKNKRGKGKANIRGETAAVVKEDIAPTGCEDKDRELERSFRTRLPSNE